LVAGDNPEDNQQCKKIKLQDYHSNV